ncbi:fimbrial protein [Scandinavium goeteborgense]|uniref:fimbrial protein n=1 Tax=Scandinavium goeteborgense TaxID=1851514 RepID=UPI000F678207|nr:fimbrial protein [Scandinavium goeteborgense]QKN79775.1 fimbrial protein [Scandinavium goeteborgense]
MRFLPLVSGVCIFISIASTCSYAVDNEAKISIKGTLTEPPPCTISDGSAIDVDFGSNVGIDRIDGVNYMRPVNYTIVCNPNPENLGLGLTFIGTASSFNTSAVQTDVSGLGIELLQGGVPFEMNKRITIDLNSPPVLQAVPVKDPSTGDLPEGAFSATATLLANYE